MTASRWVLAWMGLGLGCGGPTGGGGPGSSGDPTAATSDAPGTTGVDPGATGADTATTGADTATTGADTATTGADTDEPTPACPEGPGEAQVGEACSSHAECASTICALFGDAPPDLTAVCAAPSPECGTRLTGTVFDLVSRQPVAGIEVRALDGLDAVTDVGGATSLLTTISGDDGRVDASATEVLGPGLGFIAVQQGNGFALTASFMRLSQNGMATEIHDLWVVSSDAVAAWSAMLGTDPEIPATALPLDGPVGGVVGLVRDAAGQPVAGATVTSTDDGATSFVRYLAPDGTFTAPATSELGLFVILEPSLAEEFLVERDGEVVSGGVASSIPGAVTTFIVTLP